MKKSKAYRATDVKHVVVPPLLVGRDGLAVVCGIDVGKDFLLVVLRWSDGRYERPWKVSNPLQLRLLVAVLNQLRQQRQLRVALEPTGTYADALRQQLHEQGIEVQRVSPKMAHDYAEIFDGVPSQHDGKDAAVVAELAAAGKSSRWDFVLTEQSQELGYWVRKLDVARKQLAAGCGRLEGLLARHWPEATAILKVGSGTLLRCLSYYGGAAGLAADAAGRQRLQGWGGALLSAAKVEKLLQSAVTSVGVKQLTADVRWLQECAGGVLEQREQMRQCVRELKKLAVGNATLCRQGKAVGVATASVLWAELGDPGDYHCGQAYRKAMGLNLVEHSSGKWEGKKRMSRRGSARVRRSLYYATLRLVQKSGGNVRRWYEAKKQRDGGEAKRALVAVMRKLALALYHVGKGAAFERSRLFAKVKVKSKKKTKA